MKKLLAITLTSFFAFVLYEAGITLMLPAHDEAVEKRGFDQGVAHAGRKCWYRGYFMDGDQRYDCKAAEPLR